MAEENPAAAVEQTAAESDDGGSWWQTVLWGVGFMALSAGAYYLFTTKEQEGGRIRLWWPIALTYNFLGKWPIIGILALIGVVVFVIGIVDFTKRKQPAA